ncbi:MAG TPA: hypothetical protein VF466_02880 [Candidatus Saccharimonadales bacterium]
MKTDPPQETPGATPSAAPQPPRPRGKVFDVMAPGKAPANPTSRPVVIGHRPEAQQAQVRVSGIGAPDDKREGMFSGGHKVQITPAHEIDAAESTPKVPAQPQLQPQPTESTPVSREVEVSDPEPQKPAAPEQTAPAEQTDPATETPTPEQDAKLNEAALDPEPAAPAPAAPEQPQSQPPAARAAEPEPEEDKEWHNIAPPNIDGQVVVSHHSTMPRGTWRLVGLIALAIFFAYLVLDILLDVGVLSSSVIPHTNLF